MAKRHINLNDYDDGTKLQYDNRGMQIKSDGSVYGVIFMWLSDELRRRNALCAKLFGDRLENRYCPFDEGDKVTKLMTSRKIKMTGKIVSIVRDFYDGDCLVLRIEFDKHSSKRWIKYKELLKDA